MDGVAERSFEQRDLRSHVDRSLGRGELELHTAFARQRSVSCDHSLDQLAQVDAMAFGRRLHVLELRSGGQVAEQRGDVLRLFDRTFQGLRVRTALQVGQVSVQDGQRRADVVGGVLDEPPQRGFAPFRDLDRLVQGCAGFVEGRAQARQLVGPGQLDRFRVTVRRSPPDLTLEAPRTRDQGTRREPHGAEDAEIDGQGRQRGWDAPELGERSAARGEDVGVFLGGPGRTDRDLQSLAVLQTDRATGVVRARFELVAEFLRELGRVAIGTAEIAGIGEELHALATRGAIRIARAFVPRRRSVELTRTILARRARAFAAPSFGPGTRTSIGWERERAGVAQDRFVAPFLHADQGDLGQALHGLAPLEFLAQLHRARGQRHRDDHDGQDQAAAQVHEPVSSR